MSNSFKRFVSVFMTLVMAATLLPAQAAAAPVDDEVGISSAEEWDSIFITDGAEIAMDGGVTYSGGEMAVQSGPSEAVGAVDFDAEEPSLFSYEDYAPNQDVPTVYIHSADDMLCMNDDLSANYILAGDIDLGGSAENPWIAVGTANKPFTGSFDGNGYTISGLYIDNSSNYQGLFGCTAGARIHDFTLRGTVSARFRYTGSVVGYLSGGHVENVKIQCAISGFDSVGGLVGYNDGGIIANCENYSGIEESWTFSANTSTNYGEISAGGIVGTNEGTIYNCVNYGAVKESVFSENTSGSFSEKLRLGGIAGYNKGSISDCKNAGFIYANAQVDKDGTITYYGYVGGLCGSNSGEITGCENIGDVDIDWHLSGRGTITTLKPVGGIVGYNAGSVSECINSGAIAGGVYAGGIAGYCATGQSFVTNSQNEAPVNASSWWTGSSYSSQVFAGGVIGYSVSEVPVSNCTNYGDVHTSAETVDGGKDTASYAGGIIGKNRPEKKSSLFECKNTGRISSKADGGKNSNAYSRSGGIVGDNRLVEILRCSNAGDIYTDAVGSTYKHSQPGGIAGLTNSSVSDCFNVGNVSAAFEAAATKLVGGIVGNVFIENDAGARISRCYNTGNINDGSGDCVTGNTGYSNISDCYTLEGTAQVHASAVSLSEEQMKRRQSYTGFDFETVWSIREDMDFPTLRALSNESNLYAVRFAMNGGTGEAETQYIPYNGKIARPTDPQRENYIFTGWFSNAKGAGSPWNFTSGKIRNTMTLYANWKHAQISLSQDDMYSFSNSGKSFFGTSNKDEYGKYTISDEYYSLLTENLSSSEKSIVDRERNAAWGGSCLGIGVSLSFFKTDRMNTNFFSAQEGYFTSKPSQLAAPTEEHGNTTVSMINYYQLSQYVGAVAAEKSRSKSSNAKIQELVEKTQAAENEGQFTLICMGCWKQKWYDFFNCLGYERLGGHALMGYKVTVENNGDYRIHLLESNERQNFENSYFIVSKDYSDAEFHCAWNSDWDGSKVSDKTMVVEATVPIGELDSVNLQDRLQQHTGASRSDLDTERIPSLQLFGEMHTFEIITDFTGFSISDDHNESKTYVLGNEFVGNLDIQLSSSAGEWNNLYVYRVVTDAESLEIDTFSEYYNQSAAHITIFVDDELSADVSTSSDLHLETSVDKALRYSMEDHDAGISVKIPSVNHDTKWSALTLSLTVPDAVIVSDESGIHVNGEEVIGPVSVKAHLAYSETILEGTAESSSVEVCVGSNPNVLALSSDNEIIASVPLSYSVAFFVGGGSYIETLSGLDIGSKITRPSDPVLPGYTFDGWYTDPLCGNGTSWNFNSGITGDTTLYAKWIEDTDYWKNVIFRADGFEDQVIVVPINSVLTSEDYPEVPAQSGSEGRWNAEDTLLVEDDIIVYALYDAKEGIDYYNGSVSIENILINNDSLIVNMQNVTEYNLSSGTLMVAFYREGKMINVVQYALPTSHAMDKFGCRVQLTGLDLDYDFFKVFAVDKHFSPITASVLHRA